MCHVAFSTELRFFKNIFCGLIKTFFPNFIDILYLLKKLRTKKFMYILNVKLILTNGLEKLVVHLLTNQLFMSG